MDDASVRALIADHYAASGVDERHVAGIYADDVILVDGSSRPESRVAELRGRVGPAVTE